MKSWLTTAGVIQKNGVKSVDEVHRCLSHDERELLMKEGF